MQPIRPQMLEMWKEMKNAMCVSIADLKDKLLALIDTIRSDLEGIISCNLHSNFASAYHVLHRNTRGVRPAYETFLIVAHDAERSYLE